jgi:tubulin--tyrosine ligase
VYLFPRILALFSSQPYSRPVSDDEGKPTLAVHLTNTALQEAKGEENVRLLQELVGCRMFSVDSSDLGDQKLSQEHVNSIVDEVAMCLAETFKAAINSAVHFQVRSKIIKSV